MAIIVDAVYENGILKPDKPLPLKEHDRVRISVDTVEATIDPLADVIGICDIGPQGSIANRHDEIAYGPLAADKS